MKRKAIRLGEYSTVVSMPSGWLRKGETVEVSEPYQDCKGDSTVQVTKKVCK